ncbi:TetR/AcrR family transcriptional regulator [Nonomuraea sp. ATR24]|uniref:TetR/AcrR family transcriptional regulator n=1 Tax=Nonomuraea TaxID=83681 RepID=UPI001C5E6831|nr:TetR family transcriptional regulator [Nonomuraea ceibae]
MTGLRELQRQRVREAISSAAIRLFLARGFDEVPVTEIAAAAQVSKPTLFKYFPTKEDLVLHRIADHRGEPARVVRGRGPGESPVAALRRHFLDGLARHDPVTGLNDHPEVMGFHRMVFGTPSLGARVSTYVEHDERTLAEALTGPYDELTASLLAAQALAVQRVLARRNWRALADGVPLAELEPEAVRAAGVAFGLLEPGPA